MIDLAVPIALLGVSITTCIYYSWVELLILLIVSYIATTQLPRLFGLTTPGCDDTIWMSDLPTNKRYIQGCVIINRMSKEEFLEMISTRGFVNVEKFQYRHVRICGRIFWKKEASFSILQHSNYHKGNVKNQDELYRVFEKNLSEDIPKELSPWNFLFIEEYKEDQSAIILKSHHSLCDGLALVSLVLSLSDPRQFTNTFINFTRGSPIKQILFYVKSIIMSPLIFYRVFSKVEPITPIHRDKLSGEKSFHCTDPLPLPQLKKYCEKEKLSINTFLLTLVSAAIQRYFEDHKEKHEKVSICIPFSMRTLPKDGSLLPIKNNISPLNFWFPTYVSPEANRFQVINSLCNELKYSVEPFANNLSTKILGAFAPLSIVSHFVNDFGSQTSFNFANVPGPNITLHFMGKKLNQMFFSAPCTGTCALNMNCFSYDNSIVFGCTTDKAVIPDARILLNYMQDEMAKLN